MLQKTKYWFGNKWLKRTVALLLLWLLLHVVYITIDGCNDYTGNADVAVVLGNHVFADGSLSPWLQSRVDRAFRLYQQGKVKKIYCSGGISHNPNGNYPEGDAMRSYLVTKGIPPIDVIADNKGQNTYLTARDFISWNQQTHYASVIIVSQFYHITRSKYIFRKLGFSNVFSASAKKYFLTDITGTLREVPAFYKYVLMY